jgi:biopolymer transport protein ExbB/TolQ
MGCAVEAARGSEVIWLLALAGLVAVVAVTIALRSRAKEHQANERTAQALADSYAREAKRAAAEKVEAKADGDVKQLEGASHEDLGRIARDLARRN